MSKALEQSIIRALCFFDLFDFPLTTEELYRYSFMFSGGDYVGFRQEVARILPEKLGHAFGFYFLPLRESTVAARRARAGTVDCKLRQARRAARWIRSVPFVRAIFVCNSVALETADRESDIDFFIVTSARRIWLVRFFTNLILKITRQRVGAMHAANKVCLSFYADTEHLNLARFRVAASDIYLAYWLITLLPIYDQENMHAKIIQANSWLSQYVPMAFSLLANRPGRPPERQSLWQRAWEAMWRGSYGSLIEKETRRIQEGFFSPALKKAARAGDGGVVIEEGILKFHEHDARQSFFEAWQKRCGTHVV